MAYIFVYHSSSEETFDHVKTVYSEVKQDKAGPFIAALICLKDCDTPFETCKLMQSGKSFAEKHNMFFFDRRTASDRSTVNIVTLLVDKVNRTVDVRSGGINLRAPSYDYLAKQPKTQSKCC